MKNHWILCAALGAGIASSNAASNSQDERVDIEATVVELQTEVQELREIVENSERVTRETIAYLQTVSKSSAQLSKTLDSVEDKGFTAGINPSSRETLLSGWRTSLSKLQKNVPSLKEEKKDEAGRKNSWR